MIFVLCYLAALWRRPFYSELVLRQKEPAGTGAKADEQARQGHMTLLGDGDIAEKGNAR